MEKKLWTLRYKDGIQGATQGQIEASSFEKAEQVGRRWCETRVSNSPSATCRFIGIIPFVLADESILVSAEAEKPPASLVPPPPNAVASTTVPIFGK